MLCTNRKSCCLPLHMAVRLNRAVDSVQVWTCYSCYAIVESVWSEVSVWEVRYENEPAKVWATLCHQILCKAWRIRYCDLWKVTKGLWRTFPIQGTSVRMAQVLFRRPRTIERRTSWGKTFTSKTDYNAERVRSLARSDRRLTLRMISSELNLNRFTVHQILKQDLDLRKLCFSFSLCKIKSEKLIVAVCQTQSEIAIVKQLRVHCCSIRYSSTFIIEV